MSSSNFHPNSQWAVSKFTFITLQKFLFDSVVCRYIYQIHALLKLLTAIDSSTFWRLKLNRCCFEFIKLWLQCSSPPSQHHIYAQAIFWSIFPADAAFGLICYFRSGLRFPLILFGWRQGFCIGRDAFVAVYCSASSTLYFRSFARVGSGLLSELRLLLGRSISECFWITCISFLASCYLFICKWSLACDCSSFRLRLAARGVFWIFIVLWGVQFCCWCRFLDRLPHI